MFSKVLIANGGEIALRIARTCRELDIPTVAVYSTADWDSPVVRYADEAVCVGPPPSRSSYANAASIVEAALQTGAEAVHPGYGFLSEDPDFAEICHANGLVFVGPEPDVLARLGDKATAREAAVEAGLRVRPGRAQPDADPAAGQRLAGETAVPRHSTAVSRGRRPG